MVHAHTVGMQPIHFLTAHLQDTIHYLGSLCHYYQVSTPNTEYGFEDETKLLKGRLEMWDKAMIKWRNCDQVAVEHGIVAEYGIAVEYGIVTDTGSELYYGRDIESETQLREWVADAYGRVLALAQLCGIDAFHGKVVGE
jgi:hypothetical protein